MVDDEERPADGTALIGVRGDENRLAVMRITPGPSWGAA